MSADVKKIEDKPIKELELKDKDTKEDDEEIIKEKEVEELKEEKKSIVKKIKSEWQCILKIIEMVLCALCYGFFYEPASMSANLARHNLEQVGVFFLAFVGYLLINTIFVVAHLLKDKIPYRISALFSVIGALMFFISGVLLIENKKDKFQGPYYESNDLRYYYLVSYVIAASVLSFFNAAIFAMDGFYTYKQKKDF